MRFLRLILLFAGILAGSSIAGASTLYTYTGQPFTYFSNTTGMPPELLEPYTGNDHVSLQLELAQSLAPNLDNWDAMALIESWQVSDGIHTLSSTSCLDCYFGATFWTNASAIMIGWGVGVTEDSPAFALMIGTWAGATDSPMYRADRGTIEFPASTTPLCYQPTCEDVGFNVSVAGAWTPAAHIQTPVSEPPMLSVFALGLLALAILWIRHFCRMGIRSFRNSSLKGDASHENTK